MTTKHGSLSSALSDSKNITVKHKRQEHIPVTVVDPTQFIFSESQRTEEAEKLFIEIYHGMNTQNAFTESTIYCQDVCLLSSSTRPCQPPALFRPVSWPTTTDCHLPLKTDRQTEIDCTANETNNDQKLTTLSQCHMMKLLSPV